jgi:hypothetical protein
MLDEKQRERLRTATVELLLAVRTEYLRTPGANPLKHWEQLANRSLSAARTSATPEEWATQLQRRLQIPNMLSSGCSALMDLVHVVTELKAASAWLALVEREHGYLMAQTRLIAEQRADARAEAKEKASV